MSRTWQVALVDRLRRWMRIPVPWVFVLTYLADVALELAWARRLLPATLPGIGIAGGVLFAIGAAGVG